VSAKLLSLHLLMMSAFLIAPDLRRLMAFFVLGQATLPPVRQPLIKDKRLERKAQIVCAFFALAWLGRCLWGSYYTSHKYLEVTKSPLYGLWTVDEWRVMRTAVSGMDSAAQWQRIAVEGNGRLAIQTGAGSWQNYNVTLNAAAHMLNLAPGAAEDSLTLAYSQPTPTTLSLQGMLHDHEVTVRLHHESDAHAFLLLRRGFHWVNEYRYNL